jgi:hypothetical protein
MGCRPPSRQTSYGNQSNHVDNSYSPLQPFPMDKPTPTRTPDAITQTLLLQRDRVPGWWEEKHLDQCG